ncbi:MAG: SAM-dependent methyltransferase, partial [Pseudomonadota bacterium]
MRHFPVYLDTKGQRIVVSGAGQTAVAKLRLILKTEADVLVYGEEPEAEIVAWAQTAKLSLTQRAVKAGDLAGARLVYAANDDETEDARVAALSRAAGALTNVVDNLEASEFITPAIVDRDPVTVAIGTEGAAPVLARKIKAMTEEALAAETGQLARIGRTFREAAEMLPQGAVRREFWSDYYGAVGPRALAAGGAPEVRRALWALLREKLAGDARPGHVHLIGAGPGDPELLTQKARRTLHEADVVIHDRLVPAPILELARREALIVEVGKIPGGQSWRQDDINALMVRHAASGARVARLKSGDAGIFGRLDEEI